MAYKATDFQNTHKILRRIKLPNVDEFILKKHRIELNREKMRSKPVSESIRKILGPGDGNTQKEVSETK